MARFIGRDRREYSKIYTAHSPYLIQKHHPSRIRAFEDRDQGTEVRTEIFESNSDTLEPLREALGVTLGNSPFISKRTVLVEGPSEYYILTGIANYFEEELNREIVAWSELSIMPVRGAPNMPGKASWLESEDIEYAILLDSDEAGLEVSSTIYDHWPNIEDDRVITLRTSNEDSNIVIEDMFSPELYIKHFNKVYSEYSKKLEEDFQEVSVRREDDSWKIAEYDYTGTRLDSVLTKVLKDQPIAEKIREDIGEVELKKRKIAQSIHEELITGQVDEDDITAFNYLLARLNEATSNRSE